MTNYLAVITAMPIVYILGISIVKDKYVSFFQINQAYDKIQSYSQTCFTIKIFEKKVC